jgi:hypothetical protein
MACGEQLFTRPLKSSPVKAIGGEDSRVENLGPQPAPGPLRSDRKRAGASPSSPRGRVPLVHHVTTRRRLKDTKGGRLLF